MEEKNTIERKHLLPNSATNTVNGHKLSADQVRQLAAINAQFGMKGPSQKVKKSAQGGKKEKKDKKNSRHEKRAA